LPGSNILSNRRHSGGIIPARGIDLNFSSCNSLTLQKSHERESQYYFGIIVVMPSKFKK
jgi:hypothetical protein